MTRMFTNGLPRVYLSGRVTGVNHPFAMFKKAEKEWRKRGYRVLNPARYGKMNWSDAMRRALRMLLKADRVAVLPGWQESRGAKVEVRVAFELGIPVVDSESGEAIPIPEHLDAF